MSECKEQSYNKISDLIKDPVDDHDNFDALVWARTRKDEIIKPINGVITGDIPKWIKGCLLQNGPGAFKIGDVTLNHVFDGMALLHRYNIDNGNVTYQCRFVKSEAYEAIKTENRMIFNEFGTTTTSNGNIFQKFRALFLKEASSDNTLVTIYPIGRDIFAITETPIIRKFDPITLETLERYDLSKGTHIVFQPAHPQVYEGTTYQCGVSISSEGSHYVIFSVPDGDDKFDNLKVISRVPAKRKFSPGYIHSFGITENYFIIIEQPLSMPAFSLKMASYTRATFCNTLKWLENENNYVFLVDRKTGQVTHSFETEGFFYFHTINQFEKDGHVVLDLICYKDAELVKGLIINHLTKLKDEKIKTNMMNSRPLRFVFPLNAASEKQDENKNINSIDGSEAKAFVKADGTVFCTPELLCDYSMEFGSIWYKKLIGKSYRYFYSVGFDVFSECTGKLIKVDTKTKEKIIWQEDNSYPSEPVFIPADNSKSEDDGVVISAVLYGDPDSNRVTFVVLDAKTFKELGRCDFKNLSDPVPKTFHGWFLDGRK